MPCLTVATPFVADTKWVVPTLRQ
eukprot:IDg17356t1